MEKFVCTFPFAVVLALLAVFYAAHGNDILQNGKKYKISAVTNDLVMTADEGVYNKYLGTVRLEKFNNSTNQKWEYAYSKKVSAFKSEVNTYNNVTTKHEKNSSQVLNDYTVILNDNNEYMIKQKATRKTKKNPQCLQNMGEGNAVQLFSCNASSEDQLWRVELLSYISKE